MLHRFAIFVAVCALLVVASGAIVTSSKETLAAVENSTRVETPVGAGVHPALGLAVCGLTLGLALALWISNRARFGTMAMVVVVLCAADAFVVQGSSAPDRAVLHAWLAAALFAGLAAIVLFTSGHWASEPEIVDDRGLRFLRPLAIATPPLVLIQIVLGAMYRHKLTNVFWHMGGALLVSLATLVGSMVVIQHYPGHRALKNAATALMSVVLTQVAFGVAAFTLQLLDTGNALALELSTVSHVVVGNLTLALGLVFAIEVQRSVRGGLEDNGG